MKHKTLSAQEAPNMAMLPYFYVKMEFKPESELSVLVQVLTVYSLCPNQL